MNVWWLRAWLEGKTALRVRGRPNRLKPQGIDTRAQKRARKYALDSRAVFSFTFGFGLDFSLNFALREDLERKAKDSRFRQTHLR